MFNFDDRCRHHLLSRGLGEPLRAFIKACPGLVEAAPSSHITDGQVAGAAVDLVVAASGLRQRATSPGEAVAKVFTHAAACASCKHTTTHQQAATAEWLLKLMPGDTQAAICCMLAPVLAEFVQE